MKLVAHTLATPELEIGPALKVFAQLGFQGVEIVQDDAYRCGLATNPDQRELADIVRLLQDLPLAAVHVTPYVRTLDSLDDSQRGSAIAGMVASIELASQLNAGGVRVLAGRTEGANLPARKEAFVESMRSLAAIAGPARVSLNIESKGWSFAGRTDELLELLEQISSDAVGILFDPANLLLDGYDPLTELAEQIPYIRHIHVKDLRTEGQGDSEVAMLGQGHVPWVSLLERLLGSGPEHCFSFEYERRWHPELAPAEEWLPRETAVFRQMIGDKGAMNR